MDVLLDQTYNYAIITPVKNYSCIRNRVRSTNTFTSDIDEITDIESLPLLAKSSEDRIKSIFIRFTPPEKKYKSIKYFYNDQNIEEKMELFTASEKKKNFYTTKDRQIKKYFGDPFCRVEIKTHKRLIYKDENKLIIKILHITKHRSVNWKFFKETKSSRSISFNLKTGNFIIIDNNGIKKKHGGGGTRFRTNNFESLRRLLRSKTDFLLNNITIIDEKTRQEFIKAFDNDKFISIINEELLNYKLPVSYQHDIDYESDAMFKLLVNDFVKKRGIKVPNNYQDMLVNFFPLQKVLKKNDNKLVQSVLDMFNVKCKGTIKYVHENPGINLTSFIDTCLLFGEDYYHYIPKISPIYFTHQKGEIGSKYLVTPFVKYVMDKDEKDNILHIITNSFTEKRYFMNNFYGLLIDHFQLILKIRQYEPDLKFKCRSINEFNLEHNRLTTILTKIKKGWTVEYQFEEKMLKDVEAEMSSIRDEFSLIKLKPYILKREEDYIEEGSYMHHCVAGYSNKDKSIIVSLRTPDDFERVTCEFDIQSGRCIQARYFTNKNPPDHFLDGIELLKEKVQKYARWGLLNWKEKKKVPVKINGVEIVPEDNGPRTFHDVLLEDPFFNNF